MTNGRYSGSVTGDADIDAAVSGFTGTYSGDFFDPEAEQTVESITTDFTDGDGVDHVGTGFCNTWKDPDE